ncbi:tripartite tricarboxylate transporter substrate binding protein [Marinovum sp. 2_MG-2023]|uniref:tripartite tricarboxylate transporter substrate binding protein n=1 Tax=unclassified Marinovum TaxID=2647166 RepID=UPI0026E19CCD|nr:MULTISPECIES: tripartite tricarboxylate transporter substrate binding protein [unclassified Marinovum]MDO6731263.1 tripartite tricarboxylate transporter substrate binding protein [Marinovum sp. 2_MG-2023]MDO6780585.1 tripartite tricarboxylate transporter substrate binding protein [Marinovum sp. 1_MG-2023]
MTALTKFACLAAIAALATPAIAEDYSWKPDRPINIIVPWSAGGSTDQVTRVVAPILEEALGTEVVVVNQPGASGSTGTKAALDAPRDGYTWTANAIANNATYAVTGLVENTSIDDYAIYLHVANVPLVSVNADAPYQSFPELLEAMESGSVTVGTAGINSSGGMALAAIKESAEGELSGARMITYDGGNPAVIAAASGEVQVTTQLAVEQTEMIRAGRLRALTVLSDTALVVEGIDPVPPITEFLPDFKVAADYFGVFIPTGAPQEVYDTVDQVWQDHVMSSDALQTYANDRGAVFAPSYGKAAYDKAMPVVIAEACARVTRGEAVMDPSEIGIDCPAE